jgi:hypothetical protein
MEEERREERQPRNCRPVYIIVHKAAQGCTSHAPTTEREKDQNQVSHSIISPRSSMSLVKVEYKSASRLMI